MPDRTYYERNEYVFLTMIYLQYVASVQVWIFAVRYLESAIKCSLTPTKLSVAGVKYIGYSVGSVYLIAMTVIQGWELITYPGVIGADGTMTEYFKWWDDVLGPLDVSQIFIYTAFACLSTAVTIFSVFRISRTTEKLTNVLIDKKMLAIHCCLLIILSLAAILTNIPYYKFNRIAIASFTILP
jgi:hypothetical protein